MGLGLSALTALLLLLPGIGFVLALNRLHSPSSPPTGLDQHFSVGLVIATAAALALHLAGVAVLEVSAILGWTPAPAPAHALILLAGDLKAPAADAALRGIEAHPLRIGMYLFALSLLGVVAGRYSNRFIQRRGPAEWEELLSGVDEVVGTAVALVVLTTEVAHGDATWLYSGYLDEYVVDRDGRLERVVFRGYAARRLLSAEQQPEPLDDATWVPPARWTEIPGEVFVLQMAQARTINVDYFFEDDTSEADEPETDEPETAGPLLADG